jgi:methionyl-tRNA synthetase
MAEPRRIVVTAALPYANGQIHLGHLVEYLQVDFWTRFQKMRGHECIYICADDTHGTPIMVRARQEGRPPEALIEQSWQEHTKDFNDFLIQFDHYGSTNSDENRELITEVYNAVKEKGHIKSKAIEQLYCEHDKMFLPDRFVKGTCPKCQSEEQYGDSCDKCSATYSPADLKNAHCSLCGNKPVIKSSEHLLFQLQHFQTFLQEWVPGHTQKEVAKKMDEWLKQELREWDISRDEPYFGFKIPGYDDKYFYVWMDAPLGYIATTLQWCQKHGKKLEDYWQHKKSEIYHCIGKDIVYFHTLFWPAMLSCTRFKTPNSVWVHGMLTVNGEKMSKSKGTFISARTYLNHLSPEYLRYYYACKLSSSIDDLDLNLEDFSQRVNSDLIGKITNLGSRGAQMLTKKMDGIMCPPSADGLELIRKVQAQSEIIAEHFDQRDFSKAVHEIRALADDANRYFDEKAPWKTIETDPQGTKAVVSTILNVFRILTIYLKPLLPLYATKVEKLFNEEPYSWFHLAQILTDTRLGAYEHLAVRIDPIKVVAMVEETLKLQESKVATAPNLKANVKPATNDSSERNAPGSKAASKERTPLGQAGTINFDDFAKIDLRVAKILEAEIIPEADKLLRLKVDLGEENPRQIIAGIRSAYAPEKLVGRLTVVVANLEPRKMKFGISEGMVLAAGSGGHELFILSPDQGAKPGDAVK